MIRYFKQSSHTSVLLFFNVKTYIHIKSQGKLAGLLLYHLLKQTKMTHNKRVNYVHGPTGRTNTLERTRAGVCLKIRTADPLRGRWNLPKKKQSKPPAQWYCLGPQLQQEMNGFFFLGNVLLKKTSLGLGEEMLSQFRCFPEPGEMVQPHMRAWSCCRRLQWAEVHIFI